MSIIVGHPETRDAWISKGYVIVQENTLDHKGVTYTHWELMHPDHNCLKQMRTGLCQLDRGHRGRHTTVAFYCDMCGKYRKGEPYRKYYDINGDLDVVGCFMCQEVLPGRI